MKHGQQLLPMHEAVHEAGLQILGLQAVKRLNVLRIGMEEEAGDTTLTGG